MPVPTWWNMEQKIKMEGGLWELAMPFLLYVVLNMAIQSLLEFISHNFFLDPLQDVWKLVAVNGIEIPVFYWIYRQRRTRELLLTGKKEADRKSKLSAKTVLIAVFGGLLLSRGINLLLGLTPLPELFPGYQSATEGIYSGSLLSQIAASVVTAPILEELLVRGILYPNLKRLLENSYAAMVCASILFGILHGNLVQGVYAFFIGLYLNWLYEAFDVLLLPIGIHAAINTLTILLEAVAA